MRPATGGTGARGGSRPPLEGSGNVTRGCAPLGAWGPPLFYLTVALVFLMPLPLHLAETVIRVDSNDIWPHLWWMWWVREAIQHGQNPYVTDHLFHPFGAPLYLAGMDLVTALLSLPIQGALGLVASYNLLLILATAFGAYGMYLLALEETGSREGALVAGAVFGFSPLLSSAANLGQMESSNIGFLPLAILFFLRLRRRGDPSTVAVTGLLSAVLMVVSWYQTLDFLAFAFLTVAIDSARLARFRDWRGLGSLAGRLTASSALTLLFLAPILVPTLRLASTTHFAEAPRATVAASSLDVLGLVLPNALNPMLGGGQERNCVTLGYVATLLAVFGLRHAVGRRALWLATGAAAFALALGISLKVGQQQWELPILPYNWIRALPFGSIPRVPFRFFFLASIAQSIFASWGVEGLRSRGTWGAAWWPGPKTLTLPATLALLLALLEWWPGLRKLASTEISAFYATLAEAPPGAVFEIPGDRIAKAMYHATAHGRPILGGYVSRHIPDPLVEGVPPIKQLWTATQSEIIGLTEPDVVDQPTRAWAVLDFYGIRYVVLHNDVGGRRDLEEDTLDRILPRETIVWDDGHLRAYKVPKVPASERQGVVVGFGPGFHPKEGTSGVQRWADGEGTLTLSLLDAEPRQVRMSATLRSVAGSRTVDALLGDARVATLAVEVAPRPVTLALLLKPGYNALRLVSREPPVRPVDVWRRSDDTRPLGIAVSHLRVDVASLSNGSPP
jgi:hypothetical protein